MRRIVLSAFLALATVPAGTAGAGVPLPEGWLRVQQAVERGDLDAAANEVNDLVRLGRRMGVRRMPTWAGALAARAANADPGSVGRKLLDLALRLDSDCPEARFLESRWAWKDGRWAEASLAYLRGWRAAAADPFRRREIVSSVVGWGLLSFLLVGMIGLLVETTRYLPELGHDALELGRILFKRTNARIFAAVAVALPLFAGLGPLWLLAYLFALCWVYLPVRERVVLGIVWFVVMLAMPSLELWQAWALSEASPAERAAAVVDSDLAMPFTIEELLSLSSELDRVPSYHLLAGEATHLMGENLLASEQFGRAALAAPDDPIPHVWLGNIALEEGDTRLAIQEYRKAVQKQPDLGLAYFDLSVALDQEHLFTEADQARNRARALGLSDLPHRFHEVDGLKLAYPDDAPILLDRMTRETPPEKRRFVRGVPIELEPRILTSPWVLAFLSTGLFGALAWWARGRWMWTAQACSKCGKVFCPRCKTTNESRSYCSQCIAVFLTRGAVSIEQQAAKMEQIRRRQKVRTLVRRIGSAIVPGFGDLLAGRPTRGILNGFVGIGALAGALVWAPLFARPISAWLPIRPVQVMLFVVVVLAWLLSVRRGWGEA